MVGSEQRSSNMIYFFKELFWLLVEYKARVTNLSWFKWNFPGFSIESPTSWKPLYSQANWDGWSSYKDTNNLSERWLYLE